MTNVKKLVRQLVKLKFVGMKFVGMKFVGMKFVGMKFVGMHLGEFGFLDIGNQAS
jgi:hypothetical protein